jgi:hypothetical protein
MLEAYKEEQPLGSQLQKQMACGMSTLVMVKRISPEQLLVVLLYSCSLHQCFSAQSIQCNHSWH